MHHFVLLHLFARFRLNSILPINQGFVGPKMHISPNLLHTALRKKQMKLDKNSMVNGPMLTLCAKSFVLLTQFIPSFVSGNVNFFLQPGKSNIINIWQAFSLIA